MKAESGTWQTKDTLQAEIMRGGATMSKWGEAWRDREHPSMKRSQEARKGPRACSTLPSFVFYCPWVPGHTYF